MWTPRQKGHVYPNDLMSFQINIKRTILQVMSASNFNRLDGIYPTMHGDQLFFIS